MGTASSDPVWNRALGSRDSMAVTPRTGDVALMDLLPVHGLAMSGGVLDALERSTTDQVERAAAAADYFGLHALGQFLRDSKPVTAAQHEDADPTELEEQLDETYSSLVPSDSVLVQAFERRLAVAPDDFAPVLTAQSG